MATAGRGPTAETLLAQALADLRERIGRDRNFARELYQGLTNRRWHAHGAVVSLSWSRAEELINTELQAAGREPLALRQSGGEGELTDDVSEELGRRGWRSEPLDTGRRDDAHVNSPESPPPADTGERHAPTHPPEAARRAHDEADAGQRLFPGRADQS
jgi:hypothetical protein